MYDTTLNLGGTNNEQQALWQKVTVGRVRDKIHFLKKISWLDLLSMFYMFWALCMSSLERCLFRPFAHFSIWLFVFPEWSRVSSLNILEIKPLSEGSSANIYFPYSWFSFHFVDVFFSCAEAF